MEQAFLDALRQPRPDPGGGSAAAYGALMAVSLLEKIVALEMIRANQESAPFWKEMSRDLRRLTDLFTTLRSEDEKVYSLLAASLKQGKSYASDEAARQACSVPMETCAQVFMALEIAEAVGMACRPFLVADVLVSCEFLHAAALSCYHVGISDAMLIRDLSVRAPLLDTLRRQRDRIAHLVSFLRDSLSARIAPGSR